MQTDDFDEKESKCFWAYVGSLISILTDRNEKLGKGTILESGNNKLDSLGYRCRKFDTVRFWTNKGNEVFVLAKNGTELYVELCDGNYFAAFAGSYGGKIEKIGAETVTGESFGSYVGSHEDDVKNINAGTIDGKEFA